VIEGVEATAEDAMTRFRSGPVVLRGIKRCDRCPITTTGPVTGARDPRQAAAPHARDLPARLRAEGRRLRPELRRRIGFGERLAVGAPLTIG
jgi:uncharacterized protein YcbX